MEEELLKFITGFLSLIPLYGEFTPTAIPAYLTANDEKQAREIKEMLEYKDLEERAIVFLIEQGFAINRHDIDRGVPNRETYRELTERGRELKLAGSIAAFNNLKLKENNRNIAIEKETTQVRQANIITGKIQQSLLSINQWIALAAIVSALYYSVLMIDYFAKLILNVPPLYYPPTVTAFLLTLGAVIGVALSIVGRRLCKSIKEKRTNI